MEQFTINQFCSDYLIQIRKKNLVFFKIDKLLTDVTNDPDFTISLPSDLQGIRGDRIDQIMPKISPNKKLLACAVDRIQRGSKFKH